MTSVLRDTRFSSFIFDSVVGPLCPGNILYLCSSSRSNVCYVLRLKALEAQKAPHKGLRLGTSWVKRKKKMLFCKGGFFLLAIWSPKNLIGCALPADVQKTLVDPSRHSYCLTTSVRGSRHTVHSVCIVSLTIIFCIAVSSQTCFQNIEI